MFSCYNFTYNMLYLTCNKLGILCQSVLNVLKKEKQHQQFAEQESVRVLDYQQCIQATQTGNDQAVKADCDKVWQEIRSNNK